MQVARSYSYSRVAPKRTSVVRRAVPAQTPAAPISKANVKDFLSELTSLGTVRFIVLGEGAILESVSKFSKSVQFGLHVHRGFVECAKYTDIPGKGTLATISTEDKTFECHLYLAKLKQAKLAKTKAKHGDHLMYATRFTDAEGKVYVSCLLHGTAGVYEPAAVAAFEAMQSKYGDTVELTA